MNRDLFVLDLNARLAVLRRVGDMAILPGEISEFQAWVAAYCHASSQLFHAERQHEAAIVDFTAAQAIR